MHICKFCLKEFSTGVKLGGHTVCCRLNPSYSVRIERIRQKGIGRKHTLKARQKISKGRIAYLVANPDRVPYVINHSSKMSYPERLFRDALVENKLINWCYHYRNGLYQYDFAFPSLKIDIEIDGAMHLTEKVAAIDTRRDAFSRKEGWIVIRFSAEEVKKDVQFCIQKLKLCIASLS